jgi:curved DNA-binding protein CbpA
MAVTTLVSCTIPVYLGIIIGVVPHAIRLVDAAPHSRRNQKPQKKASNNSAFANPDDYYAILGLKKMCKPKEIKSSYRKLALQYHPDKVKDEALKADAESKFVLISQAYAVLSDPKKRKIYDTYGKSGLDASERGQDPASAGFGGGGNGNSGGFHFNGGGGGGANFDAFKLFEQMFANQGGSGGFAGNSHFKFSTGGGGFPGGGGGFGGFGGQQQSHGRQHQQQHQRSHAQQPPPADLFSKQSTPNIAKLGSPKFPNAKSKHLWLLVFYDNATPACSEAKPLFETLAAKAVSSFKLGAMDCGKSPGEGRFCQAQGIDVHNLPAYAFVVDGKVQMYNEKDTVTAKDLYEFSLKHMPQNLIHNINHPSQIAERLMPTAKSFSVLLLTDKYETSALYQSLAYKYRHDGVAFGECRAKNLKVAQAVPGGVKRYPLLLALVPRGRGDSSWEDPHMDTIRYTGSLKSSADIGQWLDQVAVRIKSKPRRTTTSKQRNSYGF